MRKMKDSGIKWIGEIPENWEVTRLKYIADFEPRCDFSKLTDEALIAYAPMENIKQGYFIPNSAVYGALSKSLTAFEESDIVMAKVTPCFENGNIAVMRDLPSGKGLGSSELFVFRAKAIHLQYLFYWLQNQAFVDRAQSTMTGTGGLKRVSPQFVKNCEIHLPPAEEQSRIAAFLDAECARIDAVIEQTRASIEEYKKLKQSVITQAVTKGVRGDRPMKDSGVEWIGEIPEDWECKPLKYVAVFQPSCDTTRLQQDSLITYTPMDCIKNGYYVQNVAPFGSVTSSLTPFENGDIAMAKVTPCFENGNIAIMDNLESGFGMGSSELFVYRPTAINTRYLLYWLQNDLFKQAACATMTGTGGLKRVSPYFAKHSPATVPPYAEQLQIVEYLDAKCSEVDRLIEAKQQFVTEMDTYKKSLIYEYVTGKKEVPVCQ